MICRTTFFCLAVGDARRTFVAALAAVLCLGSIQFANAQVTAPVDISAAQKRFEQVAKEELDAGVLPGFSVAWIVDGELAYAAGFGHADWEAGVPATPETIYRAGSISKLFNAVAAMQMVEQGKLDLDAPIQAALPRFSIVNPFPGSGPITARQMLCHRSGMIRESPTGGYFDPNEPSIAETVDSVADAVLVNPPNKAMRYSNVGPTVVGHAVEKLSGEAYPDYQQQRILAPLGMTSSAWLMNDELRPRLAKGKMRVAASDGSYHFETAPEFELGTIPAGNLYTTVVDLAKFAAFLMGGEDAPRILKRQTLEQMFQPQLTEDETGFGLGFSVGDFRGHKTVQHSGAVYGFSTSMIVLPEQRIGVVVFSNADIASGRVRRLTEPSLNLLLEAVRGEAMPEAEKTIELPSSELGKFVGEYESPGYWCRLWVEDDKLRGDLSSQPLELTPTAPLEFVADGRIMTNAPFEFTTDDAGAITGFSAAGQKFSRVDPAQAADAPPAWKKFTGSYGPKFIPLVVSIRNGNLYASTENEYEYRLRPINRMVFAMPPGMYTDELLTFQTDAEGNVVGALLTNMYLPRNAD